jgi:hypothetical protein
MKPRTIRIAGTFAMGIASALAAALVFAAGCEAVALVMCCRQSEKEA